MLLYKKRHASLYYSQIFIRLTVSLARKKETLDVGIPHPHYLILWQEVIKITVSLEIRALVFCKQGKYNAYSAQLYALLTLTKSAITTRSNNLQTLFIPKNYRFMFRNKITNALLFEYGNNYKKFTFVLFLRSINYLIRCTNV